MTSYYICKESYKLEVLENWNMHDLWKSNLFFKGLVKADHTISVSRYSIQRLSALTLSHFKSHTDCGRNSFLDAPSQIEMDVLEVCSSTYLNYISEELK